MGLGGGLMVEVGRWRWLLWFRDDLIQPTATGECRWQTSGANQTLANELPRKFTSRGGFAALEA